MMYSYMKLPDETEVVYSGIELISNVETIRVYFEKPVEDNFVFYTAECLLPYKTWSKTKGFSGRELAGLMEFVNNNVDLFYEFAREGDVSSCRSIS